MHRVGRGETLASIAKRYGMSLNSLAAINKESLNAEAGEMLLIPAAYQTDQSFAPRRLAYTPPARGRRSVRGATHAATGQTAASRTRTGKAGVSRAAAPRAGARASGPKSAHSPARPPTRRTPAKTPQRAAAAPHRGTVTSASLR
jgi:LysM repeat protein